MCKGKERAERWAPVMWFHPSEGYVPMKAETYVQSVELHGYEGRIVNYTDLSGWTGAQWKHANHNLGELYLKYCGKGRAGKSKRRDGFNSSVYYYYRSGGVDDPPGTMARPSARGRLTST